MTSELDLLDKKFNSLLEQLKEVSDQRRKLKGYEKRTTLHPIISEEEQKNFDFYHKQQSALWVPHEMKFHEDVAHYNALSEDMKRLIDIPFAFFANADADVIDELSFRFLLECNTYHELCYYIVQLYIETVHSDLYALLITHLIPDEKKRDKLFNSVKNDPIIREIHEWMDKFMVGDWSDVERKAGASCMEGIIFQSPFLFIFYFKLSGQMRNIRFANEQIAKDEGLHANKGADAVKTWRSQHNNEKDASIYKIVEEARQLVRKFSLYVITREDGSRIEIPELNEEGILTYCDLISNTLLYRFGMEQKYSLDKSKVPEWMHSIADTLKGNFYETSIGNYAQFSQSDVNKGNKGEDEESSEGSDVDF